MVCLVGMDEHFASSVSQSDLCLTDGNLQTEVMISCQCTFNNFMKNERLYLGMQTLLSPCFVVSRVVVSFLVKKTDARLPSILSNLPQERLHDVPPHKRRGHKRLRNMDLPPRFQRDIPCGTVEAGTAQPG